MRPQLRRQWSWCVLASASAFSIGACDRSLVALAVSAAKPDPRADTSSPEGGDEKVREEQLALSAKVSYEAARLRRRFAQPFAGPTELTERTCPDSHLGPLGETERMLVLEVADSRTNPKNLLPFKLLESLRIDALARVEIDALEPSRRDDKLRLVRSIAQGEQALFDLRALSKQRFLGVFHIVHYKEPELTYSPRKNRREWIPGSVIAWLVVHDLETGDAVCQTSLRAQNRINDGDGAGPVREVVRGKLKNELILGLHTASVAALQRITHRFTLPPAFLLKQET